MCLQSLLALGTARTHSILLYLKQCGLPFLPQPCSMCHSCFAPRYLAIYLHSSDAPQEIQSVKLPLPCKAAFILVSAREVICYHNFQIKAITFWGHWDHCQSWLLNIHKDNSWSLNAYFPTVIWNSLSNDGLSTQDQLEMYSSKHQGHGATETQEEHLSLFL